MLVNKRRSVGGKCGSWPLTLFNVTTPGPLVIDLSLCLPPFSLPLRLPSFVSYQSTCFHLPPLQIFSHSLVLYFLPPFIFSVFLLLVVPFLLIPLSYAFHPSSFLSPSPSRDIGSWPRFTLGGRGLTANRYCNQHHEKKSPGILKTSDSLSCLCLTCLCLCLTSTSPLQCSVAK